MVETISISNKSTKTVGDRIVLPKEFRKALNIKEGEELALTTRDSK